MFAGLNNWNPFINEGADFIWPPVPELLVVGATDGYGKLWNKVNSPLVVKSERLLSCKQSSTGHFVALNAPGVGVWTAVLGGKYTRISGTSTGTVLILVKHRTNVSVSRCYGVRYSCLLCSPSLIPSEVECRYNLASTSDRPQKKACSYLLFSKEGPARLSERCLEWDHPSWGRVRYSTSALQKKERRRILQFHQRIIRGYRIININGIIIVRRHLDFCNHIIRVCHFINSGYARPTAYKRSGKPQFSADW